MESKNPCLGGVFVCGSFFWCGVYGGVFFPIPCSCCRGILENQGGLDRTSVVSSESTLHRTEFSLFELCLIFCLKQINK